MFHTVANSGYLLGDEAILGKGRVLRCGLGVLGESSGDHPGERGREATGMEKLEISSRVWPGQCSHSVRGS